MILQVTCNAITFTRYITSYFFQWTHNNNELFFKNDCFNPGVIFTIIKNCNHFQIVIKKSNKNGENNDVISHPWFRSQTQNISEMTQRGLIR